jgi:hypothetical protein
VITILAVGPGAEDLAAAFGASRLHASVEIVAAHGAEDALERLARNRRIDAILLLEGSEARETARLIAEEDPGAPPLFAALEAGAADGVREVEPGPPAAMLDRVVRYLSG